MRPRIVTFKDHFWVVDRGVNWEAKTNLQTNKASMYSAPVHLLCRLPMTVGHLYRQAVERCRLDKSFG